MACVVGGGGRYRCVTAIQGAPAGRWRVGGGIGLKWGLESLCPWLRPPEDDKRFGAVAWEKGWTVGSQEAMPIPPLPLKATSFMQEAHTPRALFLGCSVAFPAHVFQLLGLKHQLENISPLSMNSQGACQQLLHVMCQW